MARRPSGREANGRRGGTVVKLTVTEKAKEKLKEIIAAREGQGSFIRIYLAGVG